MTRELQEFIRDLKQEIRDMRERPVTPTLGHLERWISAYRPHRPDGTMRFPATESPTGGQPVTTIECLKELETRITARFTPSLNTASALEALILVSETIREMKAEAQPLSGEGATPQEQERPWNWGDWRPCAEHPKAAHELVCFECNPALAGEGATPPLAEQDAEIARLRDAAAVFAADAAAPTCQHCGLPLTCSSERAELIHGLQQMYADTLVRAEQAEAALAASRAGSGRERRP